MKIPDSVVPILGYRIWGVTERAGMLRLTSVTSGFLAGGMPVWEPRERFEAKCLASKRCGDAPGWSHGCGIHAFAHRSDAARWARSIARIRPVLLGSVHLWGRTVESARGWRGSFAYPVSLEEVVHVRGGTIPDAVVRTATTLYGLQSHPAATSSR